MFKTSGGSWQYYRDKPALNDVATLDNFHGNSALFKFEQRIGGKTQNNGKRAVKLMLPLKYLSNFWRTLDECHWLIVKLISF